MSRLDIKRIQNNCTEDGDCLIWSLRVHKQKGSPVATECIDGEDRYVAVRRRAYEEYHGSPVPADKQVSTCGHPACLAKEHLKLVSLSEKMTRTHAAMDAVTKAKRGKRLAKVMQAARGKLTPELVAQIRASEEGPYVTARRLGVNGVVASRIKRGKSYRDYAASPFAGLGA